MPKVLMYFDITLMEKQFNMRGIHTCLQLFENGDACSS